MTLKRKLIACIKYTRRSRNYNCVYRTTNNDDDDVVCCSSFTVIPYFIRKTGGLPR